MTGDQKILRRKRYLENKINSTVDAIQVEPDIGKQAKLWIKYQIGMKQLDLLHTQWCLPKEQRVEKYR